MDAAPSSTSLSSHHLFRKDNPRKYVERKEIIGSGSFGAVYRGVLLKQPLTDIESSARNSVSKYQYNNDNEDDEEVVAIKVINTFNEDMDEIAKELRFLMDLRSKYIVNYSDSYAYRGELWIVLELCDCGSLHDFRKATDCVLDEACLKAVMAYRYLLLVKWKLFVYVCLIVVVVQCAWIGPHTYEARNSSRYQGRKYFVMFERLGQVG
jgi:hypothetical protein